MKSVSSSHGAKSLIEIEEARGHRVAFVDYRWGHTTYAQASILDSLCGDLYDWTEDTTTLVRLHANDLPQTTITRDLFPSPVGFFWFGKEGIAYDDNDEDSKTPSPRIHAFSWCPTQYAGDNKWHAGAFLPFREATGIYGVVYLRLPEMGDGIYPVYFGVYDFGSDFSFDPRMRVFAASLLFVNQKVVSCKTQSIPRHEQRRRIKSPLKDQSLFRTVILRELWYQQQEKRGVSQAPEWTHRWTVRGHWRAQFYPRTGVHQPKFIYPYVKGPNNLPLVETKPIFKVSR